MIDPEVFGDPEALRALANEIVGRAEIVGAAGAGFGAALGSATFEGRAADRIRAASLTAQGGIQAAVAELRGIATALFADAGVVEQQNADAKTAAEKAQAAADARAATATATVPSTATTSPAAGASAPR